MKVSLERNRLVRGAELSATPLPAEARAGAPTTDDELVAAARDGGVRAFDELLDRHQSSVLRVLRLMGVPAQDREDVAQEVFVRVFRHLGRFKRGRPFGAWIYGISMNAAHDYRTRRRRRAAETSWEEIAGLAPGDGSTAERGSLRLDLVRALDRLTDRERAVFVLRELEGLDTAEVARALGIMAVTVRRHLGRARRRLQDALSETR